MTTITAITSRMWINPPPTCTTKNPRIHRMNRITAMVQSIMASSLEVSYTRRDRRVPLLAQPAFGPALCYGTLCKMATSMPTRLRPRALRSIGSKQVALRCYIVADASVPGDSGERCQMVWLVSGIEDMKDRYASGDNRIRDE